jgi:hypothetical protein
LTFLGRNKQGRGIVYRMNGYTPQRVSNIALESELQAYTVINDAVGGITQQDGHAVYVLTFPTADTTKCFDILTNVWHERMYWDQATATRKAYRGMFFSSQPTQNVCGDRLTGALYLIDPAVYTDIGGVELLRERIPPRLSSNQTRFTVHNIQLMMDVGIGLNTGQGSDPQVMMQVSKDAGKTFGAEQWVSAGALGTFNTRVFFGPQGQATNFVPKFMLSDPVPFRITECLIDVTMGTS